jgi:hypothetical protein
MIYRLMDSVDYFQLEILGIPGVRAGVRGGVRAGVGVEVRDGVRAGEWRIGALEVQEFWSDRATKTGATVPT